jgi:hypothetical protein
VPPPPPPPDACRRAAELWAAHHPYAEVAEILRSEGYDGRHPPLPRCGSPTTALNWAQRHRNEAVAGENYAAALDRDDGRLVLADAILRDWTRIDRGYETDELTLEKMLDLKLRLLYPAFARLIGANAATQIAVSGSLTPPAPDPAGLASLDATVEQARRDDETAAFERGVAERAARRRRAREDEGA